jgi:hypothetical protein
MPVTISTWTIPSWKINEIPPPLTPAVSLSEMKNAKLLAKNYTGKWVFYKHLTSYYFFIMHDFKGNYNTFTAQKSGSRCIEVERAGEGVPSIIRMDLPVVVRDILLGKAAATMLTLRAVMQNKY